MNKKEREEVIKKIASVEQTIMILKHQETNLLDVICQHSYDHHNQEMQRWIHELFLGCDYIIRLEKSVELLKKTLPPRRKRGGKKKD